MSQSKHSSRHSNQIQTAMFADCLANSKKIFELIDTVFPVDSCRHYQVLPLDSEGNNLVLGMLDPSNEESLKFVNSIAKVFKYNLELKLIDTQILEIILSNYSHNSQQPTRKNRDRDKTVVDATVIDATVIENNFDSNSSSIAENSSKRKLADSTPTIISESDQHSSSQESQLPLGLEGLPPDLDFLKDLNLSPQSTDKPVELTPKPSRASTDGNANLFEISPGFSNRQTNNSDDKATVIGGDPAQMLAQEAASFDMELLDRPQIKSKSESNDFLPKLNQQLSWQKLLEQAFQHHSEEIKLTRYSEYGSIVAHQDKSIQSRIKQVPLPIFCSVIDELKRMARIPLDISSHPKKVVLERFYQQERILLRLEFAVQSDWETVIVQILRGKGLQVYEQQQMDKASEQALNLARQLEKTLRRIQACFDSAEFTNLRELQTVQSRINHQLRLLDR